MPQPSEGSRKRDSRSAKTALCDEFARLSHALANVRRLDIRPTEECAAGHLPPAISIPLAELRRRLRELPRDKEVVAYCRGPYCAFAHKAVRILQQAGFRARRLEDGLPEWKAAGLPVIAMAERSS